MKRLIIVCAVVLIFSMPAYAKLSDATMEEKKDMEKPHAMTAAPHTMMCEGMMSAVHPMPMNMCQQNMMGCTMMMRDMMQVMTDTLKVQKRMLRGAKPEEKKEMMIEIDKMIEKIDKMMSEMRAMHMKCMMGPAHPAINKEEKPTEKEKIVPEKIEEPKEEHKH